MKVYCAFALHGYDGDVLLAIFETRESAQNYLDVYVTTPKGKGELVEIEEWDVLNDRWDV